MPGPDTRSDVHRLAALAGRRLLSAHDAIVKGALESEVEVALIAAPSREPFGPIFDVAAEEAARPILRQHGLHLAPVPHASRAIALAISSARSGHTAVALVPGDQLDRSMARLHDAARLELPASAGLCVLLEDHPERVPTCPRQAAVRLRLPCVEPADLEQLRESIEQALRLSRAGRRAVAVIVHQWILATSEMVPVAPNRIVDPVDRLLMGRSGALRRKPRRVETDDVLRTARRLELNRSHSLPSPGERVPVGFVVVGPAEGAIRHLAHVFKLEGRVPVLQLRLLHPLDEAALERLLPRCEEIVVLEPRPGVIEGAVLAVAESMRQRGATIGAIWGRRLPAASGSTQPLASIRDIHPSVLARKIVHLLHSIRPTFRVASHLVPDPPRLDLELPPRGAGLGAAAARQAVLRLLDEVEQWLREGGSLDERSLPPTRIAVDGVEPGGEAERLVIAEIWEPSRFQDEGIAALRQAARDERPFIFVICDVGPEDGQDLERLARGVIPGERAERARIVLAQLDDPAAVRGHLQEAALEDRLTVLILRDGPPARFGIEATERALAEIDRLGFVPQQRLTWAADRACAFRQLEETVDEQGAAQSGTLPETSLTVDVLPQRLADRVVIELRPRLETVEVVRTRPPASTWRRVQTTGLPLPQIIHGQQDQWRAHLAGTRGRSPGPVAAALLEAGRTMGYTVSACHDATPIGAGRRAWAQVLFTRPREGEPPAPLTVRIPFGEADLVLGLDAAETVRAVAVDPMLRVSTSDRTSAVINRGTFYDDPATSRWQHALDALAPHLSQVFRAEHVAIEDVAGACRAWIRSERVADLALLGVAFQRGYVPLTIEAMEAGVRDVEARGFARSMEAFQFGRRLALDSRLRRVPKTEEDADIRTMVRRSSLLLRRTPFGGRARAEGFRSMVERSLEAMPGLTETEAGRQARQDFVLAVRRCIVWGGLEYARKYCDLISAVYRADRGDRGRTLTRGAVLPLAEAMLIREPLYVLAVATGPVQSRRTRLRLNVKRAREDRLIRRYVTRLEIVAMRRRVRLDVRTSDGPARAFAGLRHLLPDGWRGTKRERELRAYVTDLLTRAVSGAATDYDRWARIVQALHELAEADRLRGLTAAELRTRLEPPEAVAAAPAPQPAGT